MESIPVSRFKVHCLSVIEQVRKTRKPVRLTRYGEPVAEIVPPTPPQPRKSWLGSMEGTVHELGDIVGPSTDSEDWDALR